MYYKRNAIIAFEGLDCSFKETNHKAFVNRLMRTRDESIYKIHTESFPRYDNPISEPLKQWLNGTLARPVLMERPKAVCNLYAIDRFSYWYDTNTLNCNLLHTDNKEFHYFIFDRYGSSNAIYNPIYKDNFDNIVYDYREWLIPLPDVVVWMRMRDFDTLARLLGEKKDKDKNEMDLDFLKKVWDKSEEIIHSDAFTKANIDLIVIDCLDEDNNFRSKESLADEIWVEVNAAIARKCI